MQRPTPSGTATSITRSNCRRKPSTASSKSTGATSRRRGRRGKTAQDLHALLLEQYADEPFIHVLPFGKVPQSRHVRGSNMTFIGVVADRQPGRAIICATLDNLTKGASGQAVQNANLLL